MFSLVKYHNEKFSIVKSKNVEKIGEKNCIVKCNGGKYEAFLIYKNDNKSKLLDFKLKNEEKLLSITKGPSSTKSKSKHLDLKFKNEEKLLSINKSPSSKSNFRNPNYKNKTIITPSSDRSLQSNNNETESILKTRKKKKQIENEDFNEPENPKSFTKFPVKSKTPFLEEPTNSRTHFGKSSDQIKDEKEIGVTETNELNLFPVTSVTNNSEENVDTYLNNTFLETSKNNLIINSPCENIFTNDIETSIFDSNSTIISPTNISPKDAKQNVSADSEPFFQYPVKQTTDKQNDIINFRLNHELKELSETEFIIQSTCKDTFIISFLGDNILESCSTVISPKKKSSTPFATVRTRLEGQYESTPFNEIKDYPSEREFVEILCQENFFEINSTPTSPNKSSYNSFASSYQKEHGPTESTSLIYSMQETSDISQTISNRRQKNDSQSGKQLIDSFDRANFFESNSIVISPIRMSYDIEQIEIYHQYGSNKCNMIKQYFEDEITDFSQKIQTDCLNEKLQASLNDRKLGSIICSKSIFISPTKTNNSPAFKTIDNENMNGSAELDSLIEFSVGQIVDISDEVLNSFLCDDLSEVTVDKQTTTKSHCNFQYSANLNKVKFVDSNMSHILPTKTCNNSFKNFEGLNKYISPESDSLSLSVEEITNASEEIIDGLSIKSQIAPESEKITISQCENVYFVNFDKPELLEDENQNEFTEINSLIEFSEEHIPYASKEIINDYLINESEITKSQYNSNHVGTEEMVSQNNYSSKYTTFCISNNNDSNSKIIRSPNLSSERGNRSPFSESDKPRYSVILPKRKSCGSNAVKQMEDENNNEFMDTNSFNQFSIELLTDISEEVMFNHVSNEIQETPKSEVITTSLRGNQHVECFSKPIFFESNSTVISPLQKIANVTFVESSTEKMVSQNSYSSREDLSFCISNINNSSSKTTRFQDLSSEHGNLSSFSEYHPSISCNTSEENLDSTKEGKVEKDDSVKEIDTPLNVNQVVVPYSKTTKKHFCIFCKKLQCRISRHLFLMHKNEVEVKKASVLPKKSAEGWKILNDLRKKGDYEHNTSSKYNSGILIVSRQQLSKCKNKVDDYMCCKSCRGFFSKRTFRLHRPSSGTQKKRNNINESKRLTQFIHPAASGALKLSIFPVLRSDEIVETVRYDELIIKYGNKLAEKYSSQHQHDMIRSHLRLLGRFVIAIKKFDSTVNELKDVFKPQSFDKCITALREVACWNETLMHFEKPYVATSLTALIKRCANKQRTEFIKDKRNDVKAELENFLLLWEEETPLINKKAIDDHANQTRNKKVTLPLKEDIKKLYDYLKSTIVNDIKVISQKFSQSVWTQLVEATLIYTQIFNRRRAGEIERLSVENFENKEIITDVLEADILKNVSKETIQFAKQFVRISLRGKLGRTVSVLLCPMSIKAIELIMRHRQEAGITISNKYIFAKPMTSKLSKPYFRACPLLKKFAEECGAKFPESLRGTTLRKHIATYISLLNLEEASIERLANFMGHHKDIHKSIYRMPIPVAEITCVSKLLMAAVGEDEVDDEVDDEGEEDKEEDREDDVEDEEVIDEAKEVASFQHKSVNSDEESDSWGEESASYVENRRRSSPIGKTKRIRWSDSEKNAIRSIFGDLHKLKKLPTLQECRNAISKSPFLHRRTPEQIKSWIDNQRRLKNN